MLKRWWVFMMLGLPLTANAGKENSALMKCYKAHETHVEVTACLDHQAKWLQGVLDNKEASLKVHFIELDALSSVPSATPLVDSAYSTFQAWRESQCKMVEASYASGSGSGQGYLNCMIELTREQIERLNDLMGVKGEQK